MHSSSAADAATISAPHNYHYSGSNAQSQYQVKHSAGHQARYYNGHGNMAGQSRHPLRQVVTASSPASEHSSPLSTGRSEHPTSVNNNSGHDDGTWQELMARIERMEMAVAAAESSSDHARTGTVTPSVVASRRPDPYAESSPDASDTMSDIHNRQLDLFDQFGVENTSAGHRQAPLPPTTRAEPATVDKREYHRRRASQPFLGRPQVADPRVSSQAVLPPTVAPAAPVTAPPPPPPPPAAAPIRAHESANDNYSTIVAPSESNRHTRTVSFDLPPQDQDVYSTISRAMTEKTVSPPPQPFPSIPYHANFAPDHHLMHHPSSPHYQPMYYPAHNLPTLTKPHHSQPTLAKMPTLYHDKHPVRYAPMQQGRRRAQSNTSMATSIVMSHHTSTPRTAHNTRWHARHIPNTVMRRIAAFLAADASSTLLAFARTSYACYIAAVSDGSLRERIYLRRYLSCGGAGAGAGETEADFLRWELRRMYGEHGSRLGLEACNANGPLPAVTTQRETAALTPEERNKTLSKANAAGKSRTPATLAGPALKEPERRPAMTDQQMLRQMDWTRLGRHRRRLEHRWREGKPTRREVPLPGVFSCTEQGSEGQAVRVLAGCAWGAVLESTDYTPSQRLRRVIVVENRPVIRAERDATAGITRIRHRVQPRAHELQVKAAETGSGIGLAFTGVADVRLNDRFIVLLAGFVSEFGTQRHALCVRPTNDLAGEGTLARERVWMPPGRNLRMLSGRWLLVHRWSFDQDTCSVYSLGHTLRLVGQLHAPVRTSCLQAQDEHAAVMYICEVNESNQSLLWRQVILRSDHATASSPTSANSATGNGTSPFASFNYSDTHEDSNSITSSSSSTAVNATSPTRSSALHSGAGRTATRTRANTLSVTATALSAANDLATLGQRQALQGELPIADVDPQSLRVLPVDRNRVLLQYRVADRPNALRLTLHDTRHDRIIWTLEQPSLAIRVQPLPGADRLLLLPHRQPALALSVRDAGTEASVAADDDSDCESMTASESARASLNAQRGLIIRLSDGHVLHQRHWPWQIANSCSGLNATDTTTDTQPDAARLAIGGVGCAANADGRWCRVDLTDGEALGWLEDGYSVERVERRTPAGAVVGRRSPAASDADIGEGCVVTSTYFGYVERFTGLFVMLDFASH